MKPQTSRFTFLVHYLTAPPLAVCQTMMKFHCYREQLRAIKSFALSNDADNNDASS